MNDKRPAPPAPTEILETIDTATLEDVSGGINWKYQMYRAGIAISQWDPSQVAANFLM